MRKVDCKLSFANFAADIYTYRSNYKSRLAILEEISLGLLSKHRTIETSANTIKKEIEQMTQRHHISSHNPEALLSAVKFLMQ